MMLKLCCLCLLICFTEPGRQGVRKRLGLNLDEAEPEVPGPSVGRLRGGVRQRVSQSTPIENIASSSGDPDPNALKTELKREWVRGDLTTDQVRRLAQAGTKSGALGAEEYGQIGQGGRYASNMFRELRRLIGDPEGAPLIQWREIPTKGGRKTPHPFIFPHELFSRLYKSKDMISTWRRAIVGATGENSQFWASIAASAFVTEHPYLTEALFDKTIPIGLHGTEARSTRTIIYLQYPGTHCLLTDPHWANASYLQSLGRAIL